MPRVTGRRCIFLSLACAGCGTIWNQFDRWSRIRQAARKHSRLPGLLGHHR